MLGDESRHVNESYTPTRGEGALPTAVVVIPDTQIMYNEADSPNHDIFDLYEVGSLRDKEASVPFVHGVELAGPRGEIVRFRSVFDDGALVNAIDETLYQTLKGRLSALSPSEKILRMADGRHVPSVGVWKGRVTVSGVNREGVFEIFKSNGAWAMLFGKPLLKAFNAIHDYTEDTIRILQEKGAQWTLLPNQFTNVRGVTAKLLANLTVDIKQLIIDSHNKPTPHTKVAKAETAPVAATGEIEEQDINITTYKLLGGLTTPRREVLQPSPILILNPN